MMKHIPIIVVCGIVAFLMFNAFAWATGPNAPAPYAMHQPTE
jgi:hypothetical protein